MEPYFKTEHLSVGYDGQALIRDICIQLEKGKILTLIGPNGAGKSTILKSITRHLQTISGRVYVGQRELPGWKPRELARQVAVVLTDRIRPELTTCAEVVAMGRYPHTDLFGRLTQADREAVWEALEATPERRPVEVEGVIEPGAPGTIAPPDGLETDDE